ncbi:ferrous iron transport protein B [Methanothermococcus okinawensis]|uniref:Ferrous iron transport protein B n=1 Tax=Methanothermococcus okinawensis (strain DSM 14208 / JCM 11175 / IH1) TaxID=647113 RepID=F8AKQ1_METOI|nr:ferrous iron transport protein B [Methanothermococcus okinawensis]AEH06385.1 ferrous iron transport protein B [Methanothermococcus okinawensis IH1]
MGNADGNKRIVALTGQPNVGKTTLFNSLTGMRQEIGNWPGVTVEKKEGLLKYNNKEFKVVDLPGIYSLMSNSIDQKIARDFILENEDAIIVDVIDTPNINRNLYLTLQLIELGKSPILCLNLIDEAEKYGITVDEKKLSERLGGLPVIKMSGRYNVGIDELKKEIYEYKPKKPCKITYSKLLEDAIEKIVEKIDSYKDLKLSDKFKSVPKRWLAISLLEGDPEVLEEFKAFNELLTFVKNIKDDIENNIKHDVESYVVEQRYQKSDEILKDIMTDSQLHEDIDTIILHPFYGFVIFGIIMYLMYSFVFGIGDFFSNYIDIFFGYVGDYLTKILPPIYAGFIVDGALSGVGAVLEFFPQILLIMFSLAILEDCGYLSRVAALMNGIMSKIGLGGKAFIPFIISFGCNVPGLMATRFMSSHKERLITLLVAPLVPCSARFVIIGFMASAFFSQYTALFTLGILAIVFMLLGIVSYLLSKLIIKGESEDFIFELPPYRTPDWKNILKITWERSKEFLKKAGTVIVAGSLLFYWLLNYPSINNSYGIVIGKILEHITLWMGIDWRGAVSLMFGIVAKELVVSTMNIVYGGHISTALTPLKAFVFTLVSVLYIPCLATVATQYAETRSLKWTLFAITYNLSLATVVGIIVYNIGKLLGF